MRQHSFCRMKSKTASTRLAVVRVLNWRRAAAKDTALTHLRVESLACSGNQPAGEKLSTDQAIGAALEGLVDCEGICGKLQACSHNVAVSTDPGRFICNWIAYNSIRLASRLTAMHPERPVISLFW